MQTPTMPRITADLETSWIDTLDRLRRFVAARVNDNDLAADITQDVIVRSIASGALDRAENPAAWLYRSARNAVIDHYRTRKPHEVLTYAEVWPEPDSSSDVPNEATRELSTCLGPLLEQLTPPARDALRRVDLDGQTQQRAAVETGISLSGMKSRVQRARRDLKELLERCCVVHLDAAGGVADYRPISSTCGCATTSGDCS